MTKSNKPERFYFSRAVLRLLPAHLRRTAEQLRQRGGCSRAPAIVLCLASEILSQSRRPSWTERPDTRFLAVLDVAPALTSKLPSALGLHKPQQRLYVSSDKQVTRRFLIAQFRDVPSDGIVDAYMFQDTLFLLLGDMVEREIPVARIEKLAALAEEDRSRFEINEDGSFLSWPDHDLDFGVRQLLKQIDPEFFARLEIERSNEDFSGDAVRIMRETRGLNQAEVKGLSERQVRRIEKGESNLTLDSARRFSESFGLALDDFLRQLAEHSGRARRWEEESFRAS